MKIPTWAGQSCNTLNWIELVLHQSRALNIWKSMPFSLFLSYFYFLENQTDCYRHTKEKKSGNEQMTMTVPCLLREQSNNAKDKEHKKHPWVLKIIHVRRVQNSINKELEMGRIQKLDTQINKSTNGYNIKLQVLNPPIKTWHRIPCPNPKGLGVGYISDQRAPYMPQPNYKKQWPWHSMTLERTHLGKYICNSHSSYLSEDYNLT